VPRSFTYVAESGVKSAEDVLRLRDAGVDAILIGSYLMQAAEPRRGAAAADPAAVSARGCLRGRTDYA
jgi:indole-3-glycerol phosphate synthase